MTTHLSRKQQLAKKLAGGFKFKKQENQIMNEIDLKERLKKFRVGISVCMGVAVAACGVSYYFNSSGKFVSNFTDSMPKGYYSIVERNPASVTNEEIVTFCPDHTVYLSESFARRYLLPAESGENCWVTPLLKVNWRPCSCGRKRHCSKWRCFGSFRKPAEGRIRSGYENLAL